MDHSGSKSQPGGSHSGGSGFGSTAGKTVGGAIGGAIGKSIGGAFGGPGGAIAGAALGGLAGQGLEDGSAQTGYDTNGTGIDGFGGTSPMGYGHDPDHDN